MSRKFYDLKQLKANLDCRKVVEQEIGAPKYRGRNAWQWQCPFHYGQKYSFSVWKTGWKCWADCHESGSVIDFIMKYYNKTLSEACEYLGAIKLDSPPPKPPTSSINSQSTSSNTQSPSLIWQAKALEIIQEAEHQLWATNGKEALNYLLQRGLEPQTIKISRLGYIPGMPNQWLNRNELCIPAGITIPSFAYGHLWQVRVRRLNSHTERYRSIRGGKLIGSLFLGDHIQPLMPLIIVEGEFDALILYQLNKKIKPNFSVAALSSTSNTLSSQWYPKLATAPRILFYMDNDSAGHKCLERHKNMIPIIESIQTPIGKDINEFYLIDPTRALNWIQHIIENSLTS